MKALTACTFEVDDVDFAVEEILEQLDLEKNLKKNSVGIVYCYSEFLDSGVVKALAEALPFDLVGATTIASSTQGRNGYLMLSLMVLTSDKIRFSSAISTSLFSTQEEPVRRVYEEVTAKFPERPALIMPFVPLIRHVGGELIFTILDSVSGGLPLFGTLAMDHTQEYVEAQTIHNGESYFNELVLLAVYGDIDPEYLLISIPEEKTLKQKAIITSSTGNVLKSINDIPFLDYMETLGLTKQDDSIMGLNTIPIVVDYNDGTKPVTRAVYMVTKEGHAICGGKMPLDATLAIGTLDPEDVVQSAKEITDKILSSRRKNAAFIYPCLSRILVLDNDPSAEMKPVCEKLTGSIPYLMAYSGGEICPVYDKSGKDTVNRLHNFTIIVCLL